MTTIDTFGWDVVHAVSLTAANAALQGSGTLPTSFKTANATSGSSAEGTWAAWQLVPSAPSNYLDIECTVASGTGNFGDGAVDITGAAWTMRFMPQLGSDGVIRPSTDTRPLLVKYSVPNTVVGADVYKAAELFDALLIAEIVSLNGGFGKIALGRGVLAPDQTWLIPTSARAATTPLPAKDPRGGIVAIIAMTENRSSASLQTAVDARVFTDAPDGTNAAFIVGPNRIAEDLLLPAMVAIVQGSKDTDFDINKTGTIYNKNSMSWGNFNYSEKTKSYQIKPNIPPGNIELTLNGPVVHLSMSDINFPYPGWGGPGEITVSFGVEQFTTFKLVVRDDGGIVLVPEAGKNDSFNVTVVPSEAVDIFQIAISVVVAVLFCMIGGAIEGALEGAETAAENVAVEEADESIVASMSEDEISGALSNASDEEIAEANVNAAEDGANAVVNAGNAGYTQSFGSCVRAVVTKIVIEVVNRLVSVPFDKIVEFAVAAAEKKYDDMPSIVPFAESGMKPVTWQSETGMKVTGGALDNALVFWGVLSTAAAAQPAKAPQRVAAARPAPAARPGAAPRRVTAKKKA